MARATEALDGTDTPPGSEAVSLHERDLAEWALAQSALIRAGRLDGVELENVAEEIESLGREQFAKVRSSIRVILVHMLRWDHQPELRSWSWAKSIRDHRDALEDRIEMSPSLRRRREEAVPSAYRRARLRAADETKLPLSTFPAVCLYSLDEILERRFDWPEE